MVPYLDMPYNEASTAQLTWKLSDKEDTAAGSLSVVHHGRTRKYCQLYRSYGDLDNDRVGPCGQRGGLSPPHGTRWPVTLAACCEPAGV